LIAKQGTDSKPLSGRIETAAAGSGQHGRGPQRQDGRVRVESKGKATADKKLPLVKRWVKPFRGCGYGGVGRGLFAGGVVLHRCYYILPTFSLLPAPSGLVRHFGFDRGRTCDTHFIFRWPTGDLPFEVSRKGVTVCITSSIAVTTSIARRSRWPGSLSEVGTPAYVYSHATADPANFQVFSMRPSPRLPHLICFAMKRTRNLAVLTLFSDLGRRAGCGLGGELFRGLKAVYRRAHRVRRGRQVRGTRSPSALQSDILMFNVESGQEASARERGCLGMGRKARVAIRVNPDVDPPHAPLHLRQD